MNRIYLLFFLIIFFTNRLTAQQINEVPLKTINEYVEGYNTQNFQQMRDVMSTILRIVLSPKKLKMIYGTQFEMLGKAKIDKIVKRSESSYLIYLKYERDTTESEKLGLSISGKGKIIGLGNPSFKFLLPKKDGSQALNEKTARAKIDSIASLKHNVANFNGCVLVMKNNSPFYQKCFGYTDFESKTQLDENTLFDLASLSKQFTAMSIMLLKKQGKLAYAQKVEDFIPDFPYKNISVQNLLNHTSGLPDYMELFENNWDKSKIAGNKDVMEYLKKFKPKTNFKPGKEHEYSNTGYVVLASIIEQISGKSYAQFVSENIFQPLEMSHSRVYNTKYSENEIVENYAKGYTFDSKSQKYLPVSKVKDLDYFRYLDGITGDGGVNSTNSDLAKWDNALRAYKLLSKEEFEPAIQSFQLGKELIEYGYGWELQTNDKHQKLIYHSGNWGGNINFILHSLETDLSVIILSNNEYFNVPKFAFKIAEIMNR